MLQQHDFKTPGFYSCFVSCTSPELEGKIISNGVQEVDKVIDWNIRDLMILCFYDFPSSI